MDRQLEGKECVRCFARHLSSAGGVLHELRERSRSTCAGSGMRICIAMPGQ